MSDQHWVQIPVPEFEELHERIRMLNDIALSAIGLWMNIENRFPPSLDALTRDLAAYRLRFGKLPAAKAAGAGE